MAVEGGGVGCVVVEGGGVGGCVCDVVAFNQEKMNWVNCKLCP